MPVGIAPQRGAKNAKAAPSGSLEGSFAHNLAHSVDVYTRPQRLNKGAASPGTPRQLGGGQRPPSRQARAKTPTFTDRERAVIANLDQLEVEELEELNERLRASRVAKVQELRNAQDDKAALQVELQTMLATLADSRQASQHASAALQADRSFVARILRKYQTLVNKLEAQKGEEDNRDFDEMRSLRLALAELHGQMQQAKNLQSVLSELEKTNAETSQISALLRYHKIDLSIVKAGSRQALAKAKAHKDALFQALVGLERQLLSAKQGREERLLRLGASREEHAHLKQQVSEEEEEVLRREVTWLQQQLKVTSDAKGAYGGSPTAVATAHRGQPRGGGGGAAPAGPAAGRKGRGEHVTERSDVQVQLLKAQIDDLESEIADIKDEVDPPPPAGGVAPEISGISGISGAARRRPTTAAADGLDRKRTAPQRAGRLENEMVDLRNRLKAAEHTLAGDGGRVLDEEERAELAGRVDKLEAALGGTGRSLDARAGGAGDDKAKIAGELDWLESLIDKAERGQAAAAGDGAELARLLQQQDASSEAHALAKTLADSRTQLDAALDSAQTSRADLAEQVAVLSAAYTGTGDEVEQIAEQVDRLSAALATAGESNRACAAKHEVLAQRLLAAESDASARAKEVSVLREKLSGGVHAEKEQRDNAALRQDMESLERDLKIALDASSLAEAKLRHLEANLHKRDATEETDAAEPRKDEVKPPEYEVRKRIFGAVEPQTFSQTNALPEVTATDVAELALVWGLDPITDAHLMWVPGKALRSVLPVGWKGESDRHGDVFYHEIASGFRTYSHPCDARYRELLNEAQEEARKAAAPPRVGVTENALEIERLRLRQASADMERQARLLKEQGLALRKEVTRSTLSIHQQDDAKLAEWQAEKGEALKVELASLREEERQHAQGAREKLEGEIREQLYAKERNAIREEVLAEEKQRLAVERLRLRQKIVKEETDLVRARLEAEEGKSIEEMRVQIREALLDKVREEEERRLAQEQAPQEATPQSILSAQDDARERHAQATRARQQAMDDTHRKEVEEYATYLGMDPLLDDTLLWIAEMALTAPLPTGWTEHEDTSGNIFFFNAQTGGSTYEHPLDASFKAYYQKVKTSTDTSKDSEKQ